MLHKLHTLLINILCTLTFLKFFQRSPAPISAKSGQAKRKDPRKQTTEYLRSIFLGGVSMSRAKRTPEKQDAAIRAYRSGEVSCSWIKKYREDSEGGLEDMRIR